MPNFTASSSGTYLIHDYDEVWVNLSSPGSVTLVGGGAEFNKITIDYAGHDTQADYVEVDLSTFTGDLVIDLEHYDSSDEIKLLGATLTGPMPGYPGRMGFSYVGADGNTYTGTARLDDEEYGESFETDPSPIIICFAKRTMLATPTGSIAVEDLCVGDALVTSSGRHVTAKWIGQRKIGSLELKQRPSLRPIRIDANALGPGVPARALAVSPQHRLVVDDHRAQVFFGQDRVLAAATHLVNGRDIYRDDAVSEVTYFHVFTGAHDILIANGAPAESLYLGKMANRSLDAAALAELQSLFPKLFKNGKARATQPCSPVLSRRDCQLLRA